MAKIVVKCHAAPGFSAVWAGQRRWPDSGTEVETISGPDDIEGTPDDPVFKLGTRTLDEMETSGRFSFGISGTIEEIEGLRAENAELKTRVAEVEAENTALKAARAPAAVPVPVPSAAPEAEIKPPVANEVDPKGKAKGK